MNVREPNYENDYKLAYIVGCGNHPFMPIYHTVYYRKALIKYNELYKKGYMLLSIRKNGKIIK